ncbi:glutamate 5-kinase [Algisphaera agarilytica]|uniref:Glutamate 5-kinase n=1 Tax=Algisphaera agarilytica TaxID=1385975 RepID=A0A7X0H7D0_9BACT|nr:glutamate 5-kinase [Algisphaera agarilytica]MBB6430631.1 glutamate 5-kinase [Algisphaera agarilytica]
MSSTDLRQSVIRDAKQVVVKIGTQLITGGTAKKALPAVDLDFIADVARQIAELADAGVQVTLVSSGAIGAGCVEMGLDKRPTDVAEQQAVAAIGQRALMTYWHDALAKHGLGVGQVLLTRADFDDRLRFLNIRNCVTKLHEMKCIPVLNENDTVAVEEIRFGDNDLLAALMCSALRAQVLLLLTSVDGLLDGSGKVIDRVDNVLDQLQHVRQDKSTWGSGGMQTKLEAARVVTESGELAVIASGKQPDIIRRVLSGEANLGTVFAPAVRSLDSRRRWIGLTARPAGAITLDPGAAEAISQKSKSLLAAGVRDLTGRFERGDVVMLRDPHGKEIARGLTNYSADELRLIQGKRSNQIAGILGKAAYKAVVQREHLVLLGA